MPDNEAEEIRLLREIARWTRETALPIVRPRVERLLNSDPKKRVYAAIADGAAPVAAVEKSTGANHNDIRAWLKEWEAEGIVVPNSSPPRATFTLLELGIAPAPERTHRVRKQQT